MNKWLKSTIKAHERYVGKRDKPVVWEVGSRDGHDGVELARAIYSGSALWFWSHATIICFEPNPVQADIIRENYSEVEVYELAASNKNGQAQFIVYEGDEGAVGSSSLDLNWKGDDLDGTIIQVETVKLGDMIEDDEIIDIMKIDVEGHSLQVLEGLGDRLNNILVIHVETETWTGSDKKVEEFMKARNWTLIDVVEQYGGMPDQLWVNSPALSD